MKKNWPWGNHCWRWERVTYGSIILFFLQMYMFEMSHNEKRPEFNHLLPLLLPPLAQGELQSLLIWVIAMSPNWSHWSHFCPPLQSILSPASRGIILKFKSDQVTEDGKGFQQGEALEGYYNNPGLKSSWLGPGKLGVAKMMRRASYSDTCWGRANRICW